MFEPSLPTTLIELGFVITSFVFGAFGWYKINTIKVTEGGFK